MDRESLNYMAYRLRITKDSKLLKTKLTNGEEVEGWYNGDSISYNLYKGNKELEIIEIPNGITRICSGAFEDCTALTTVTIPSSVKNIEWNAFAGCKALQMIVILGALEDVDCWYDRRGVAKSILSNPSSDELVYNLKKGYSMDLHFKGDYRDDHWD